MEFFFMESPWWISVRANRVLPPNVTAVLIDYKRTIREDMDCVEQQQPHPLAYMAYKARARNLERFIQWEYTVHLFSLFSCHPAFGVAL